MSGKKPRVPVNAPHAGLSVAFNALEITGLPAGEETKPATPSPAPATKPGRVVLRRETAGRGGKTVVVIDGFAPRHTPELLSQLAKRLRSACGCGGSVQARTIEMQGDQPSRVRAALEAEGFDVAGVK